MGAQPDLTPVELREAFQIVRDYSAVDVHPLLDRLEQLLDIERAERAALKEREAVLNLVALNAILVELGEPETCLEETERSGINLAAPDYGWPQNPDLARDIARGK